MSVGIFNMLIWTRIEGLKINSLTVRVKSFNWDKIIFLVKFGNTFFIFGAGYNTIKFILAAILQSGPAI